MHTTFSKRLNLPIDNLDWVDALRGIAIVMVIIHHCFYSQLPWRFCRIPIAQMVMAGQYGVQFFFVASAFTLARSWHRRKTEAHPLENYFIRRLFRIAPLYIAGVLAYSTMVLIYLPDWNLPAKNYTMAAIGANLLFLHGWLPFAQNCVMPGGWSIGVEMSFYLLVPWLVVHLRHRRAALIAVLLSVGVAGLAAWGAHLLSAFGMFGVGFNELDWPVTNNSFLYFWLPTQLPVFLLGFLIYSLLVKPMPSTRPKNASFALLGISLLTWIALSIGGNLGNNAPPPGWLPSIIRPHYHWISPTLAGFSACTLILSLELWPWVLLVNRVTLFLGKLSYSLYVVHFFGAWVVTPWIWAHVPWATTQPWGTIATFVAGVLGCFAFSIPMAMLTHSLIEKPGIALGKRIIQKRASLHPETVS